MGTEHPYTTESNDFRYCFPCSPSIRIFGFSLKLSSHYQAPLSGEVVRSSSIGREKSASTKTTVAFFVWKLTPCHSSSPWSARWARAPLLNDDPTRMGLLLLMRLWTMHSGYTNASCHYYLDVARIVSTLERFNTWVGMSLRTWSWFRYHKYQAHNR